MRGLAVAVLVLLALVAPVLAQDAGRARAYPSGSPERGGIEGEPIALDSSNPAYGDFLAKMREQIRAKWGFPCGTDQTSRRCERLSVRVSAEFGVLEGGQLKFVEITRSSGAQIYDDYARFAVMLASPYPRVPPAVMAAMKPGSRGAVIGAEFSYFAETMTTSLTRQPTPDPRALLWGIQSGLPTSVRGEAP